MKKLAAFPIIVLFLVFSTAIYAQEVININLPHVSNINIEARNNLIRLTWVDSPEARGPVYIYRSARPFTGSIPANIRPIIVRYGTQYYIDDTDDLGSLYYYIAASDTQGRRYDVIIPQTNSTNINLAHSDEEESQAEVSLPVPVAALPEPPLIEGLSNLRAAIDGEKVTVSFNNTNPERSTILYRSTRPVRRAQDLINAVIVPPGRDSVFTDYPVPGPAWYYAVIYEDEVSGGNININPGVNTTITAAIISTDQVPRSMRPIPLPELSLSNQITQIPLGDQSIYMLRNNQLPPPEQINLRMPRVFVIDLQAPAGGEESALFQIINDYFVIFDWENARINLQHFLSLPRSKDVEARARFYLGQCLYFTENYREALMEFLSFRSYHPIEANIWVETTLSMMVQ